MNNMVLEKFLFAQEWRLSELSSTERAKKQAKKAYDLSILQFSSLRRFAHAWLCLKTIHSSVPHWCERPGPDDPRSGLIPVLRLAFGLYLQRTQNPSVQPKRRCSGGVPQYLW